MSDDPTLTVAQDLRSIVELSADLPRQATNHATSRLMPGGLAMVALGPVASIEAVGNVVDSIETGRLTGSDELADNDDDWEPPLQTLRFWSEAWRIEWGREVDGWTVQTEAAFLLGALGWAFKHEPHWDDFAKDMAAAKRRLEDVLHDGEREERSWVPCLDCDIGRDGKPINIRLVKVYAKVQDEDRWTCPRCKRKYDETGFNQAQGEALRKHTEEARTA